jgi:PKD repeat protein
MFLLVTSGCKKGQVIQATADFTYKTLDSNFTVPVNIQFTNGSTGANQYKWTFEGGEPATSNKREPGVISFNQAGTYKITLEASNEDSHDQKIVIITVDSAVAINFDAEILVNNYAPANVQITNKTIGAVSQQWSFEGAVKSTSSEKSPGIVTYNNPGVYTITLTADNGRRTFTLSKKIEILPSLKASFGIVPSFDDDDYQAPLTATLQNQSNAKCTWKWATTPGGKIDNDTAENPTVFFSAPGTYTVTLSANNEKETKTYSRSITVLPNTNLRSFTDVKLGISTAHSTIGSFFSTKLRKMFTAGNDLLDLGGNIDVVYYGLNKNFKYNSFVSPDSAAYYTFNAIPNAQHVTVINTTENCNCSVITPAQFDNMDTDALFQNTSINFNAPAWKQFDNSIVPRVVLYKTADGRKGAIKVKDFVDNGLQSYIICDIKVQKEP